MLTFLPCIGFFKSLRPLDDARLGKQRQDALSILKVLLGEMAGDANHPAVAMWSGYEYPLGVYGMSACSVWQQQRGNRDSLAFEIHSLLENVPHDLIEPPWLGDLNFHRSHRSYLIRRKPDHYESQWPNTPENMPLLWPQLVTSDPRGYRLRLSQTDIKLVRSGERKLPDWLEFDANKNEVISLEEE